MKADPNGALLFGSFDDELSQKNTNLDRKMENVNYSLSYDRDNSTDKIEYCIDQ